MSLDIDIDNIHSVLLADGWHEIANASFVLDSYEYSHHDRTVHGGGNSGICATGFSFHEYADGYSFYISGPLTAILAVREHES